MSAPLRDPAILRRALRLYVLVETSDIGLAALRGGATALQLRAKSAGGAALFAAARELALACAARGALLVVNDRLDVALASGAGGVHLGQDDLPVSAARAVAGPGFIIGASAGTPDEARRAERDGADYLGAGSVNRTCSKEDAGPPIGLTGLAGVIEATRLPVVAIGGIDADSAPRVVAAGAAGVAVISAVVARPDVAAAAADLRAAVDKALRGAGPGGRGTGS